MNVEQRRYPVGQMLEAIAKRPGIQECVGTLSDFPVELSQRVVGLSPKQLSARYRPGSWTVQQLVHHCADSHMHALIRIKQALTKDHPTVFGYDEGPTAELLDYRVPISNSLSLLRGLHARFSALLQSLSHEQLERTYFHDGHQRAFTILETAAMYEWHCRHHLAHVDLALAEAQR